MVPTVRQSIPSQSQSAATVFVGRQPIYTCNQETFAYELLFRSDEFNRAKIVDGEQATAEMLLNVFAEIGLKQVVGDLPAFINIPEEFILNGHCSALPKQRVVLEVLEDVRPTAEILAALTELRDDGYTIALDDFVLSPELIPLVELADIIKVDLPLIPSEELPSHVEFFRKYDVKLLAEKVETYEEFEFCKSLGFDYFQGYFFCRPTVIKGKKLSTNRVTMMRLLAKLQCPTTTLREIADIVQTEPALSYKLLRYVNSAYCGLEHTVESIQHAVTIAGARQIKTISSLSVLTDTAEEKPPELIQTVLSRAKMMELLAGHIEVSKKESYFLTGLFSAMDALLDLPMEEALDLVPVSREVEDALTLRRGKLGMALNCVLEYELGNWANVSCGDMENGEICDSYLQAIVWAKFAAEEG